jgi:hypothetical protein
MHLMTLSVENKESQWTSWLPNPDVRPNSRNITVGEHPSSPRTCFEKRKKRVQ